MLVLILFCALCAVSAAAFAATLFLAVLGFTRRLRKKSPAKTPRRLKTAALLFAAAAAVNAGLILLSQLTAHTPPIRTPNGIAELRAIDLNGRRQWISLRGEDRNKPVLLFLAGGPGGSQMAAVRHELSELEKHFVVVNWDQPGSGKSYGAAGIRDLSVDTYIRDGHALTAYLKERFSQEKICLIGESWGSALGVFLAARYPEDYRALIGTGQMVDFAETERMDYAAALKIAEAGGDTALAARLRENGEPPYFGPDMVFKSAVYLNFLNGRMAAMPEVHRPGYHTLRDLASPEYGLLDKFNYLRGIINTFNHVYPQLYGTDLRRDFSRLGVPVYFFLGRFDLNAPLPLAEEYAEVLDAPDKKIIWFEHSGHSPWINEPERFVREVLSCFLSGDTGE